jgi:hypothetical protein
MRGAPAVGGLSRGGIGVDARRMLTSTRTRTSECSRAGARLCTGERQTETKTGTAKQLQHAVLYGVLQIADVTFDVRVREGAQTRL